MTCEQGLLRLLWGGGGGEVGVLRHCHLLLKNKRHLAKLYFIKDCYAYPQYVALFLKVNKFSGKSRKFFLPVLCMPEAHNSGGSKIIFLWLLIKRGKWVLDIHLSSHEILNALIIPNTLNFNEL